MAIKRNIFVILFLTVFFAFAMQVSAATCDPSAGYFCNPLNTGGEGTDTLADAIILAVQILLSIVGLISLLFLVVGGIKYTVAAGNEDSMTDAKNTVTSALIGLALALMSYGIVKGLEAMLKVESQ